LALTPAKRLAELVNFVQVMTQMRHSMRDQHAGI
jgi:hypothetical protein